MTIPIRRCLLFCLLASTFITTNAFGQGDLLPPGGPASTMKTLQQIEPRIPISQTNIPMTISTNGSYYLTENVSALTTTSALITINARYVTLDLNGFAVDGSTATGSASNGIATTPQAQYASVFNGTVRDCLVDGVRGESASGMQFWRLRVAENGRDGILAAGAVTISDCVVAQNGRHGIFAVSGAVISGCTAVANATNGILVSGQSVITDCTALANGNDGFQISGVAGRIQNCTSANNDGDGIEGDFGTTITGNDCHSNGQDGDGAGVRIVGFRNRVEANHVTNNDRGIFITSTNNLILKNSAAGNSTNYVISTGNRYGPIVNLIPGGSASVNGNAALGVLTTSDPWANFAH